MDIDLFILEFSYKEPKIQNCKGCNFNPFQQSAFLIVCAFYCQECATSRLLCFMQDNCKPIWFTSKELSTVTRNIYLSHFWSVRDIAELLYFQGWPCQRKDIVLEWRIDLHICKGHSSYILPFPHSVSLSNSPDLDGESSCIYWITYNVLAFNWMAVGYPQIPSNFVCIGSINHTAATMKQCYFSDGVQNGWRFHRVFCCTKISEMLWWAVWKGCQLSIGEIIIKWNGSVN